MSHKVFENLVNGRDYHTNGNVMAELVLIYLVSVLLSVNLTGIHPNFPFGFSFGDKRHVIGKYVVYTYDDLVSSHGFSDT